MTCHTMLSLGVYVLGAADPKERRRVEAHLPTCPACQAELARLAPLPGLLAGVPLGLRPVTAGRPVTGIVPGDGQRGASRRGVSAGHWWRAAAAACVAGVAGFLTGLSLAPGSTPHPAAAGIVLTGWSRTSHVTATARLTETSWGTSIDLRLRGLPQNVVCRLVVRSRTGATEVSGVWDSWKRGVVEVPASTAWRPSGIASLEVLTATRQLVTINTRWH